MQSGLCLRLYLCESDQIDHEPALEGIIKLCQEADLHSASILRGVEGMGKHGIHSTSLLALSSALPLIVEVVATEKVIQHAITIIHKKLPSVTMTTWPVQIISPSTHNVS